MPADETFPATGIEGYRPLTGWRDYLVRPFLRDPRAGPEGGPVMVRKRSAPEGV
jgi:hypothetical protein